MMFSGHIHLEYIERGNILEAVLMLDRLVHIGRI